MFSSHVLLIFITVAFLLSATFVRSTNTSSSSCTLSVDINTASLPQKPGAKLRLSQLQQLFTVTAVNNRNKSQELNAPRLSFQSAPPRIQRHLLALDEVCFAGLKQNQTETRIELNFPENCNKKSNTPDFAFSVRIPTSGSSKQSTAIFTQHFYTGLAPWGNGLLAADSLVTTFPSIKIPASSGPRIGFHTPSGYMAGAQYSQFGEFSSNSRSINNLRGGIENSSVMVFFKENDAAVPSSQDAIALVVSPMDGFMTASLENHKNEELRWGIAGGVAEIPAGHSASWLAACSAKSVPGAVREFGAVIRRAYGKPFSPHERDRTLRYLGYTTDNGADLYYETRKPDYVASAKKILHFFAKSKVPIRNFEFDSYFYFLGFGVPGAQGIKNWTFRPDIAGGGEHAFRTLQTFARSIGFDDLAFAMHSRHFAPDNVYASNPRWPVGPTNYSGPRFDFTYGLLNLAGLPTPGGGTNKNAEHFWKNFFQDKVQDVNLQLAISDWESVQIGLLPQTTAEIGFGDAWLKNMADGAAAASISGNRNLSLEVCMSYPRSILASLQSPAFTQARASNDYGWPSNSDRHPCPVHPPDGPKSWAERTADLLAAAASGLANGAISPSATPDYYQWRIGVQSLFAESVGLAPSKDDVITSSRWHFAPHYCPAHKANKTSNITIPAGYVRETRNRLQSLAATMSNGPVILGDGFVDVRTQTDIDVDIALVMRSCRSDGLLLRPCQSAVPLDYYYNYKSFTNPAEVPRFHPRTPVLADPVLQFTTSSVSLKTTGKQTYMYLLAANSYPVPNITFEQLYFSAGVDDDAEEDHHPVAFYAWETNSSARAVAAILRKGGPGLDVGTSDELSFKFYTFVPVFVSSCWVLFGEADKWISASAQRFSYIQFDGSITVVGLSGAPDEVVNLVFARIVQVGAAPAAFMPVSCKIGAGGASVVRVLATGQASCEPGR